MNQVRLPNTRALNKIKMVININKKARLQFKRREIEWNKVR